MTWCSPDRNKVLIDMTCNINVNPNPTLNQTLTITGSRLQPTSNKFFRGPYAIFPPSFVTENHLSGISVILLTNKQTRWKHYRVDAGDNSNEYHEDISSSSISWQSTKWCTK